MHGDGDSKRSFKNKDMFNDYVLPTIDQKVTELVGQKFQIYPGKRIYLEPGTITKTSSGKIKHQANVKKFRTDQFEGLLAVLPIDSITSETDSDSIATVQRLFKKIVEQNPLMDVPFLELGRDSIKIVEFVETLQDKFSNLESDLLEKIDNSTTLSVIVKWLQ